jgi:hypothetical protein
MKTKFRNINFINIHAPIEEKEEEEERENFYAQLETAYDMAPKNYVISSSLLRLLPSIHSAHKTLPYCTEIRWLSCHKVLDAYYGLIGEIMTFGE